MAATAVDLLTELQGHLDRESYQKAVDVCNKIVAMTPNDPTALKTKTIALIRMDKIDKALDVAHRFDFLKMEAAYCHYKLKHEQKALDILATMTDKSPAALHLEAQAHYRLSNYNACIALYETLLAQAPAGVDTFELKTNLVAAYTAAGRASELAARPLSTDDSYELAFNKSFIALQSGDLAGASALVDDADRLCRSTLAAEGYSPAEIEQEALVVAAQKGYVLQLTGRDDDAHAAYQRVAQAKLMPTPADASLAAVVNNNIATLHKHQELFDSIKRLKAIAADTLRGKCAPAQHEAILANLALLWAWMKKARLQQTPGSSCMHPDECRDVLVALKEAFPASALAAPIQLQAVLGAGEAAPTPESLVRARSAFEADLTTNGRLCLAHVLVLQKQPRLAADAIRSIADIAHSAGTVATLVALYDQSGDVDAGLAVLQDALAHHAARDGTSGEALAIQEGDGAYQLAQGNYAAAAGRFETLLSTGTLAPEMRLRCLAKLVVSLSFVDAASAEARSSLLPRISAAATEPEALIKARSHRRNPVAVVVPTSKKRAAENPERIARKRATRRAKHLEALKTKPDYNPLIGLGKPDPERWIPRKQRSRGNRRHRNKFVGAQGSGMGSQKDAAKLDAAARAAAKKAAPPETKGHVVSGPSAMERKAAARKRRR
ncbi:signal recognition particle [Achlya hypogyna]|uniref:Signal recognition particle subunit SRP72 n=1 Tax=Achlya hypogyna TaxID=1202772 RepID=A0A1V9ZRU4_ACHHY|nr:signal recognition particle [Achlya hypogyna]